MYCCFFVNYKYMVKFVVLIVYNVCIYIINNVFNFSVNFYNNVDKYFGLSYC